MEASLEEKGLQSPLKQCASDSASRDDALLARLGKKPVLKRNFGFLSILGFSCTVLITWEGSLTTFLSGLSNGGPSGLLYGFLVVWVGTLSTFATLSELVSMAPTSGGQYHWVSMLAPSSSRKFLGYLTGWLAITGWQALIASGALVTGTMIQGLILLTHPEYAAVMKNWHGTLLLWAVVLISYGINTAVGSLLAKFEGLVLFLHILGFFAVILPLCLISPHGSAKDVFDTWLNAGLWQTQGLSFSVGILGNVFAFLGGDCAIHMSEEIRNAAVVVPRSLMTGLIINGTLGFGMMIATLYSIGNIDEAIAENPQYPFMSIFRNAVGSTAGAAVMSSIVVIMSFSATTGVTGAIHTRHDDDILTNTTGENLTWGPWRLRGGIRDRHARYSGLLGALGKGHVGEIAVRFHCLFCHGYEERGAYSAGLLASGFLGNTMFAPPVSRMVNRLAATVNIYTDGNEALGAEIRAVLKNAQKFRIENREAGVLVRLEDGTLNRESFIAHVPNVEPNSSFTKDLGVDLAPQGHINALPPFFNTNVPGVYAAGDCATLLKSVPTATMMGSLVAAGLAHALQAEDDAE
ncbi:hypothetical protein ONZ43_g918 [Nemania bipapillata]|uniref:Uncharacterized protein n=1 Tax=Nemania bipapillata TaxID=110536 RepID=A0ACC2J6E2_9PEZI|nr:hypothetical protein ONZ43_g918 [Nemania bipapillata]